MGKSFKLQLLIFLFIGTCVVIAANRLLAQHFLSNQLTDRLRLELAQGLHECGENLASRNLYRQCFDKLDPRSLTAVVADEHQHCPPTALNQDAAGLCPILRQAVWRPAATAWGLPVDQAEIRVGHELWFAVRHQGQPQGDMLMLSQADIASFQKQIWALRDRNLIYVLPFIVAALFVLTLFLAFMALRPLRQLEQFMLKLDSSNLQGDGQPQPEFVEFRRFLSIFQDLRSRLNVTLSRARRFAGDASHELRTPLTILRGHCEQLIRRLPVGSKDQIQARVIGDEVERLITIVEKLLLLSRADADSIKPQMQALNLTDAVEQMVSDSDPAHSGLAVRAHIEPNIIWQCDRTLILQVIQNLYANAVNYNLPDGWIQIELAVQGDAFSLTLDNPTAELSEELLERAFERFYRADAAHARKIDGHGLGLSLCLEIAKVHGASLRLQRKPGPVFSVTMTAPLRAKAA